MAVSWFDLPFEGVFLGCLRERDREVRAVRLSEKTMYICQYTGCRMARWHSHEFMLKVVYGVEGKDDIQ